MGNESSKIEPREQRLSEEQLKAQADGHSSSSTVEALPSGGRPLPKGFKNPPGGQIGHKCLDTQGNYQPKWFCLLLHDGENTPERQSFNCAGKRYSVRVGEWVDVPPEIIEVLSAAEVATVRYSSDEVGDLTAGPPRPEIVGTRPRFTYNVLPSA